jgi:hypothetical protein
MSSTAQTIKDIKALYESETDPVQEQALFYQYEAALDAALGIVDIDIGSNAAKLKEATEKLQKAIDDVRKAKRELGDVAEAIKKLAKAVDFFVKIASLVAGA